MKKKVELLSRKIVATVLLAMLMFGMTACGGSDSASAEALKKAEVGDIVPLGSYEQDNDTENGAEPIEWMVLAVEDNKALLISVYVLEEIGYHEKFVDTSWKDCTLREWLNKDFYKEAFTSGQKNMILETELVNEDNEEWESEGGEDTVDKVFILSHSELVKYFPGVEKRYVTHTYRHAGESLQAPGTPYAIANGLPSEAMDEDFYDLCLNEWGYREESLTRKASKYWVRTPGCEEGYAMYVTEEGQIIDSGATADTKRRGVRPAMWVEFE